MQSHIHKVYVCLAVTCHLHFWQNDRDLSTAVTRGWNGYRNKSQRRKSTLEKKFSRPSCRDSNPRPFNHESGAVTTELCLLLCGFQGMMEVSMIRNEQNRVIHQLRKFLFKFGTPSFGIVRRILQNTADKCMVSALHGCSLSQ